MKSGTLCLSFTTTFQMREKYYLYVVDDKTEDKKDQNPGKEPEAHSHLLCYYFLSTHCPSRCTKALRLRLRQ